jgi:hypothetical protein
MRIKSAVISTLLFIFVIIILIVVFSGKNDPSRDIISASDATTGSAIFGKAIELCGVTIYQERPSQELNIIGNKDQDAVITVSSVGYSTVIYLTQGSRSTINAHLVRDKEVTIKVELIEFDGTHDGTESCKPKTIIAQ